MVKKITAVNPKAGVVTFIYSCVAVLLLIVAGCDKEPPVMKKAPSPERAPAFEGTIVAVGDSLTAGLGVAEEAAYPARLARKLKKAGYNYRVINAGVSGETSTGARSRIEWVLSSLKPDIIILGTGANDGLRGIDPRVLESNLDQICGLLKENNVHVVLAGMRMLPNLGPDYIQAFAAIFPRIAKKHQVVYMPFFLEDVAGDVSVNQPDRMHPTAQGYARIVENMFPFAVAAIERHREGRDP